MPLTQLTNPGSEPVTLDDTKLHLRVEVNDDDALITNLIVAARQRAELLTRYQLIRSQWRLTLDAWPDCGIINLPRPPLVSIESVKYLAPDGVLQTLDSSLYTVDIVSAPGRLLPAWGQAWPSVRNDVNAILVEYTAGWQNAAAVPQSIKSWMLLAIGAWYAQREAMVSGTLAELPRAFWDGLLDEYRILSFPES